MDALIKGDSLADVNLTWQEYSDKRLERIERE
jgi:hypothetical protein